MCHMNLEPNQSLQCRAHTGWALQDLVLWSLCSFEDLTPNTFTLYKEIDKSEVYFITTCIQIFNQCRLLVFSQRFFRLGVDLKTNAMLFLHSEIFGMFAVFNKYFV